MNLGRYQLGDWVTIPVLTGTSWPVDGSSVRSIPTVTIFDENQDLVVVDEQVPPVVDQTGLHILERQLGPEFAVGTYDVYVEWDDAGDTKTVHRTLEVVAGGHSAGAYIGLNHYDGHNASYIQGMTDSGLVEARKGPQV